MTTNTKSSYKIAQILSQGNTIVLQDSKVFKNNTQITNLIKDSSFETPVVTKGYEIFAGGSTIGAWTVLGTASVLYNNNSDGVTAEDGLQSMDLVTGDGS